MRRSRTAPNSRRPPRRRCVRATGDTETALRVSRWHREPADRRRSVADPDAGGLRAAEGAGHVVEVAALEVARVADQGGVVGDRQRETVEALAGQRAGGDERTAEVGGREVDLDPVGGEQVRDPDGTPHEADEAAALHVEDRAREARVAGPRPTTLEADARRSRWRATRR